MNYVEYEEKDIQSFEYETTIISDGNITGVCELGEATIQLINDSNEYSTYKSQWIKTVHGSFYIHDVEPVQEKINIKLSCYDIKYKLDTTYDSSLYTFPMTLKEYRNKIFDNCDVSYDDSDFPNSDLILTKEPYIPDSASNRTVISMIAQAGLSNVITDSNDIFYFSWFNDTTHQVDDWLELTSEKESTEEINTMVLGRGDVEDNVYYPTELPDNPVEFRIDNNYILDPQEDDDQRYDVIEPLYNRISGFSYLVFSMRTQDIENKLSIKLGDKIKYLDIWGNELTAYVMTKKITWLGGDMSLDDNYEITLSAEEINETSTEYSYANSIENKVLNVQRTTDKINGEITDIIEVQEEHTTQISKTIQSLENIQNIFQITGGINLIKNSVGLFDTNYWTVGESETYEFGEDSDLIGVTTSKSKITLSNGTLTTTSDNITGLTLTDVKSLSYKMKQDADTTTTITLYGLDEENPLYTKTFSEEVTDWTSIYDDELNKFYADSTDLTLKIESTSTYDGKFYISDLMLNNGEKQDWQPASGEVWGTIIKMSQMGITVYSVNGKVATLMNSNGFGIYEYNGSDIGDVITDFDTNGVNTNNLTLKGKIDQQDWVTDIISSDSNGVWVLYQKE